MHEADQKIVAESKAKQSNITASLGPNHPQQPPSARHTCPHHFAAIPSGAMALEAMASGVPVVSTPVGMSVDLIKNNISGKLAKDFEAKNLLTLVTELLNNKKLNKKIIRNALSVVDDVNWYNISEKHYSEVYLPLINK